MSNEDVIQKRVESTVSLPLFWFFNRDLEKRLLKILPQGYLNIENRKPAKVEIKPDTFGITLTYDFEVTEKQVAKVSQDIQQWLERITSIYQDFKLLESAGLLERKEVKGARTKNHSRN